MVRSESGVGRGAVGFCPEQETGFLKFKLLVFSLAPGMLTAGGLSLLSMEQETENFGVHTVFLVGLAKSKV